MTINPETKQKIQLFLAVAILISAVRAGYVFYQRHNEKLSSARASKQRNAPLDADYYVTPKKLYPYDLKSARQLTEQPVWVKEGYRYTYYPYDPATHRTNFQEEAGTLLPLQKLEIVDVASDISPGLRDQRQVMAVFRENGKHYAFPIGAVQSGIYRIYSDEMLFVQDPHQLYKHWPPEIWQAIDDHQVKPGMNELQADFAIGMGTPENSGTSELKTVHYPNGGHPVTIVYQGGKAAEIAGEGS